jgi:hypothetical protein
MIVFFFLFSNGINTYFEFIAPNREEIPAKCNEKMARSTDPPLWAWAAASGG